MRIDLIIENANIVTMDQQHPVAHSIGVLAGNIVALDEELKGVDAVRRIDLGGATVIPGLIDAHCHTAWFGRTLIEVDLATPSTVAQVLDSLKNAAAGIPEGEWILAAGYNQHLFGGAYPSIAELDEVSLGRPLVIRQSSGHAVIANSAALELAGILDAPNPAGGVIERDGNGRATGRLEETAQDLVLNLLKPYRRDDIVEAIERATKVYAEQGITSFTEAGIGAGWIGHTPTEIRAYQEAAESGRLHARAQLMPTIESFSELSSANGESSGHGMSLGLRTGFGDEMVRIGPVKIFVDGSLTGHTCALSEPFVGEPDNVGMLLWEESEVRARMLSAAEAGWAIAAHAIGDRAIDIAIDVLDEAQKLYGSPPTPHRIEHVSYLRDDQLPKLAAASIAVTPQALFVHQFGDEFLNSLGSDRAAGVYRAQSLVDAGVVVAGSSDRPCLDGNPFVAIRTLLQRRTLTDTIFAPHEIVSPEIALSMYTRDAAVAIGAEGLVGMLTPGLKADMVILDRSPLEVTPDEITDLKIIATLLGGVATHGSI